MGASPAKVVSMSAAEYEEKVARLQEEETEAREKVESLRDELSDMEDALYEIENELRDLRAMSHKCAWCGVMGVGERCSECGRWSPAETLLGERVGE